MSAHTPGPWTIDDTLVVHEGLDMEIANIGFVDCIDASHGEWDFGEISQANARLIAAAPDLVAFAEFVLRGLERGHIKSKPALDFSNMDAAEVPMLSLHAMARDVIAKATGEQP